MGLLCLDDHLILYFGEFFYNYNENILYFLTMVLSFYAHNLNVNIFMVSRYFPTFCWYLFLNLSQSMTEWSSSFTLLSIFESLLHSAGKACTCTFIWFIEFVNSSIILVWAFFSNSIFLIETDFLFIHLFGFPRVYHAFFELFGLIITAWTHSMYLIDWTFFHVIFMMSQRFPCAC